MAALPIILFGGAAVFVVPRVSSNNAIQSDLKHPKNEDPLEVAQKEGLQEFGALASQWSSLHQKQWLMGGPVSDTQVGIDFKSGRHGYEPDKSIDPLKRVWEDHVKVANFDRRDTVEGLVSMRGQVRPKRQHAIVTTLTPELHHPNNPAQKSAFLDTQYVPHNPNHAQIRLANSMKAHDIPERSQRRHTGVQFFNRAPGQSFRYE